MWGFQDWNLLASLSENWDFTFVLFDPIVYFIQVCQKFLQTGLPVKTFPVFQCCYRFITVLVSSNFYIWMHEKEMHMLGHSWNILLLNQRWYFVLFSYFSFRKFLFIYQSLKYWFSKDVNWFSSLHCLSLFTIRFTVKVILI